MQAVKTAAINNQTQSVLIDKVPWELSKLVEHKEKLLKAFWPETGVLYSNLIPQIR